METKQIKELFEFLPKSKRNAKYGQETGDYPFFASSNTVTKFVMEPDYTRNKLIIGDGGTASINYADKDFSCSDHCYVLKPTDEEALNCKYIFWYLNTNLHILEAGFKGIGIKNISKTYIQNIKLTIPSKEEQDKIVTILDKADEIRAKKKLANDKLDEFLKSTFVSMFGDPVRNEKNFKKDTFGAGITTLSDYHANGSYEILRQHVELLSKPDYALMIRTTDLENKNYTDDVNYITEEAYNFLEKSKIYGGEIIINKIGSAGKVYFMPNLNRPVSLGMNAFLLRFNENLLNNVFTYYMLISNSVTTEIQKRVKGAVTKTITKDAVREIPIIYPPMKLQNKFAKIVEKVEAQKQKNELVIEQMNSLFNSLSQRAFKGEL